MEKGETFLSLKTLIIHSFKINRNMHGYIYIFDIYEKKLHFKIASLHHENITSKVLKCFGGNNPTVLY